MSHTSRSYDVFLSYNTRDHAPVERVGRWLREQGLSCFMDRWYLVPGTSWQAALQEAVDHSKAVIVFLGPGELGRWQQRELQLALDRQTVTGTPVVPVLLPGSDPPLGFLSLLTWVDLRDRIDDERPLRILSGAVRGLAPAELEADDPGRSATQSVCPFRGLLAYREEDAPLFFGRDDDTERLVEAVARHPFVSVVGASGSGKSSVVRAGLVPKLRADRDKGWDVLALVPTARPLNSLVNALAPLVWPDLDDEVERREKANEKTASLQKGTLSLRDLVEIALSKQPGTQRLLLFVDQWEELYTLCRDDNAIRAFTDQLLDASRMEPLTVVFTSRADFYGNVLGYRPLVDRIREGAQVTLGPMDSRELARVIEAPAKKMRLEFESDLAGRILRDVGEGQGRLPLLSFLLEQLWKRRRGLLLTHEAYNAMGGVEKAIATVAEEVFTKLSEPDQRRLSRVFIQLVSVGETSQDTRRRAAMTTLGDDARPLVARLATARLLVTSAEQATETVEVAHEALIRHWDRSKTWVDGARDFLSWRNRLKPFVDAWKKLQGDHTALLRGGLLAEAQRWLTERRQDLDPPEREFIEASLRKQEAERDAERRKKITLIVVTAAAVVAACYAWMERRDAVANAIAASKSARTAIDNGNLAARNEARANANAALANANAARARKNEATSLRNLSSSLAAQAAAVRNDAPPRSVLLATEAIKIYLNNKTIPPVIVAEQSLRDSVQNLGGRGLGGHTRLVIDAAISPDGKYLATASYDGTARLWDLSAAEPEKTARVLAGHPSGVTAVKISSDGKRLVTTSSGSALLWDLSAAKPEKTARVLAGHTDSIIDMAISPDGKRLVTASKDRTLRIWDLSAAEPENTARVLAGHTLAVLAVAISPDGRRLVTGSDDTTARLWDLSAADPEKTARILPGHTRFVSALAISPDGKRLVTAGGDATARLWDLSAAEPEKTARVLAGHTRFVSGVEFSPNGKRLVTAGGDATVRLWDLSAVEPEKTARVLAGHKRFVRAMAISPDGKRLVTGSDDNTARLWDLSAAEPEKTARVLAGHTLAIWAVAISPNGHRLVTASGDTTARLWDLSAAEPGETAPVLAGHQSGVSAVVISPDGKRLVTGSGNGIARLWDLSAAEPETTARVLARHRGAVRTMAISPDGKRLVTGSDDNTARLWDLSAAEPEKTARVLAGHKDLVRAVAITRDGKWLVTASNDATARLWDLSAAEPEKTARILAGHSKFVSALAITPDGKRLVTASGDETARLWDLSAAEPEKTARVLAGHRSGASALAITPDGKRLVTGSGDGTVRLWDLSSAEPEKTARVLAGHQSTVHGVAISRDGNRLVTGSADGTARLWDLTAAAPEKTARILTGHWFTINSVVISPDGQRLVTLMGDATARLWDLSAAEPEKTAQVLAGHTNFVTLAAISPDGRRLVTGSEDGTARIWSLRIEDVLDQAERAVGRNFTHAEWAELFPDEPYRKTFERLPVQP